MCMSVCVANQSIKCRSRYVLVDSDKRVRHHTRSHYWLRSVRHCLRSKVYLANLTSLCYFSIGLLVLVSNCNNSFVWELVHRNMSCIERELCELLCVTGTLAGKSRQESGNQDPARGHLTVAQQGVVAGGKNHGFSQSPVLCPYPGCLHDSTHDVDQWAATNRLSAGLRAW